MKKGFSLVEVSIVLLCLGLLAVIVFRGGILIHSSEVRAEVGKMNKNATAVSLYYTEINAIPGYDNDSSPDTNTATYGRMNIQDMLNRNFITEFDLESEFSPNNWAYYQGVVADDNITYQNVNYPSDAPYTILLTARTIGLGIDYVERRFLCSFEKIVDDENLLNGTGRYFLDHYPLEGATAYRPPHPYYFDKCYKIKSSGSEEKNIRYIFMIFAY
ncbi:MAG: prepilin-type N-terminal cleavage/methylation domain-containing protein [Deferribacteraceae bacterium]|nr:prepilin-type N-terminal cleavage/methylation domain-containing protein [Deferribacteraceae bacterium]